MITGDELATIKERASRARLSFHNGAPLTEDACAVAHAFLIDDVPRLVAEIERLPEADR